MYPDVPAVFVDTGLEYPEIKQFVRETSNVRILKPSLTFKQVLENCGYPIISKKVSRQIRTLKNPTENNEATRNLYLTGIKRDGSKSKVFKLSRKYLYLVDAPFKISEECCNIMKKRPMHKFEKETKLNGINGMMASDGEQRRLVYLQYGCNAFEETRNRSMPLGFWTTDDIWSYIKEYGIEYSKIYDKGVHNTGCIFCMFGVHLDKYPNRFQCLKKTHPKLWKYCLYKLGLKEVLEYINIPYE